MGKIKIDDLNEEVTLSEESVQHVRGGASYLKLGDIDGESQLAPESSGLIVGGGWGGGKHIDLSSPLKWKV